MFAIISHPLWRKKVERSDVLVIGTDLASASIVIHLKAALPKIGPASASRRSKNRLQSIHSRYAPARCLQVRTQCWESHPAPARPHHKNTALPEACSAQYSPGTGQPSANVDWSPAAGRARFCRLTTPLSVFFLAKALEFRGARPPQFLPATFADPP